MKNLTTRKITSGLYEVNEIKQRVEIAKSVDQDNLWILSCDELNVRSSWDTKKDCLRYLESVIFECGNYDNYKFK